ncbi:MAG: indole-3-glycerol phosphate synthase TrpC [Hyphomonadaceae bacterium]|nr:indole-3-glycerol phosphate synthase TrpC [Hyphomonadaceae bacterium]
MNDVLAHILAYKAEEVAARKTARPLAGLEVDALAADPPRGFAEALRRMARAGRFPLIAEIKKASPSKGLIREDFEPAALARAYEAGGAACLSILTDGPSFQGADAHLAAARAVTALPVLRKDFIVDPYQVVEARALGADAVLVIMAAVSDSVAATLVETARTWRMDVLVECHDADEVNRALRLPAPLIGINNRDLRTFETRLEVTERLAPLVPAERRVVAESGIASAADLARLARAGAGAFLVGEALMRQPDVAEATRRLLGLMP